MMTGKEGELLSQLRPHEHFFALYARYGILDPT